MKQKVRIPTPPSSPSPLVLPPKMDVDEKKECPVNTIQSTSPGPNPGPNPIPVAKSSELIILSDSSDDENPRRAIRSNPASLYKQRIQDSPESIISISSSDDEPLYRTGRRSVISDEDDEVEKSSSSSDVYSIVSTSDGDDDDDDDGDGDVVEYLSGDEDSTFMLERSASDYSSEESDSTPSFASDESETNESAFMKVGNAKNWRISGNQPEALPESVAGFSLEPPRPSTQTSFKARPIIQNMSQSTEKVVDEIVDDDSPPKNRPIDAANENELRELARIKLPYFLSIQQLNARGCRISRVAECI